MPKHIALLFCLAFIVWLFARDRTLRPMSSRALWIPFLWIMIVGSKAISIWLGADVEMDTPDQYLEGSPLDRHVFLLLIIAGCIVLFRRRIEWRRVVGSNTWFLAFFLYCLVSILWSDYPFVSIKRWIKELGNVVMILIVLTEKEPMQAVRAIFSRYTYFALSLSVVLIKYFPETGRYYNRWTWEPAYAGITTSKNELGCVLFICGLFLLWETMQKTTDQKQKVGKMERAVRLTLFIMLAWLLTITGSSTSVVCLVLGAWVLLFLRHPRAHHYLKKAGTYSLATVLLFILLQYGTGIIELIVGAVGRDITLTGRTDLWEDLLKMPINPLLGTGYKSFWLGPRVEILWEKYYFHPNQAHNGYLETYLNGGIIGLCLLMGLIISTGTKLKKDILRGCSYGHFRFALFIVAIFYNWTEAMIGGPTLVWLIFLLATLHYPRMLDALPAGIIMRKVNPSGLSAIRWPVFSSTGSQVEYEVSMKLELSRSFYNIFCLALA
jgi:exopolysaccharide production protein ExoQ